MIARPKNNLLWVMLLCTSTARPSHAFILPTILKLKEKATTGHESASMLAVSTSPTVRPTDSTSGDSDYHDNDHQKTPTQQQQQQQLPYATLQEANRALDILANKCGAPAFEPVVSRADECQSTWEIMRSTAAMTPSVQPDTVSLNIVLKAWSKCCQSLAEYKKHAISPNPPPSDHGGIHNEHPQVYTAKDAAERATLLLLSQERDYQNHVLPESARPDVYSYNEVIGAWAKSGVAEAPQNAERLLKRMLEHEYIRPDSISYNSVLDAWAYSGKPESLQKVKHIWQHMEQLYDEGTKSNDDGNHIDDDGNNNKKDATKVIIKPTIRTVNSIIHAHSKRVQEFAEARDFDSARKIAREAEEFLELMKERYEQTQDPDHMPDVTTYTSVMDAYGRCGRYASTLRAKALLDELLILHKETGDPRLKPNVRTYTSLITAWSKTRSAESPLAAESLLEKMNNSGDPDLQPNARTYTAVIHAWGRSSDHTKAERALKLLQQLKQKHKDATNLAVKEELKPSLVTYNAALEACCRCQGDIEQQTAALKIAFAILKTINQRDSGLTATALTYATVLRACGFLLQPGEQRNQVATAVFEKAKKAGVVDFRVLLQLRKTVDAVVLAELLEGLPQDRHGIFDFNGAPPAWSRNVR